MKYNTDIIDRVSDSMNLFAPSRSAWDRGVLAYAEDFLFAIDEGLCCGDICEEELSSPAALKSFLLNGADNWRHFSYGGCGLCYDEDIAKRVCTPSELKKTRNGMRNPNSTENAKPQQHRKLA